MGSNGNSMVSPRIFVSHSHRDDDFTNRLISDLRKAGGEIWVDIAELRDGDFMERINRALSQTEWVVLVMSPDSLASPAVQLEINAALNLLIQRRIRGVIPIICRPIQPAEIPPTWSTLHWYDAHLDYERGVSGLLRALGLRNVMIEPKAQPQPNTPGVTPHPRPVETTEPDPGKQTQTPASQPRTNGQSQSRSKLPITVATIVVAVSLVAILGRLVTAGNGSPGSGNTGDRQPTQVTITCPSASEVAQWHLVNQGKLTVASDTTYGPAEFADPNNPDNYIGYDIDLARELARRLCLQPTILKTDFGSIISDISGPPLGQQHYDMSLSSITINDFRKQKVDMIPYFTAGESILVKRGNPTNITSIQTMCGRTVAVQSNTIEFDELQDANGEGSGSSGAPVGVCKTKKIKVMEFADQSLVIQQVLNNTANASYQDQPITNYYVSKTPSDLEEGGITVTPAPQGIVMRKDNAKLEQAISNALNAMRADGTYLTILKKWGVESMAYPPLP